MIAAVDTNVVPSTLIQNALIDTLQQCRGGIGFDLIRVVISEDDQDFQHLLEQLGFKKVRSRKSEVSMAYIPVE